jgi:hypothetical protein
MVTILERLRLPQSLAKLTKFKQMKTTLGKVALGAVIAVCVLYSWLWYKGNDNIVDTSQYYANAIYDSMAFEIEVLKADKKELKDSLYGARVEKGYIEIELNRSRSEVDRLIIKTKTAKANHDTVSQFANCDSLIMELEKKYLPTVDTFQIVSWAIDSMERVKDRYADSLLDKEYALRKLLINDLHAAKVNNEILRSKAKKKPSVWLAVGGFLAGMLTTIFITK